MTFTLLLKAAQDVILRDDLLELLDLTLESYVGPLQVLDVLVLGLHGDDLHVQRLLLL